MKERIAITLIAVCLSVTALAADAGNDNIDLQAENRRPLVPLPVDWKQFCEGELDLSFLLHQPAGKAGFVVARNGHYYTGTGRRIKFWGVNLTGGACFPRKQAAAKAAEFISRLGLNIVRLHFLDSNWGPERSLFPQDKNTTRELDPVMLDRLDFFIAQLKRHGVYANINLNVGRTFRAGDGVKEWDYIGRAKGITLFDKTIIELEKEYAWQLLTHRNPYTGNQYVNEPALAVVELVNENSLTEAWVDGRLRGTNTRKNASNWSDITPYYANELTRQYNQWLKQTQTDAVLRALEKEAGVKPGERIPRLSPKQFAAASTLRFSCEAKFLMETERRFFTGMHDYLKKELKLHAVVIGNSDHGHSKPKYALLSSLALLDGVDGHVYWQHPSYRRDASGKTIGFRIPNTPMVNDPLHSTVVQLARSAVAGKPYTVSEVNHPFPNEFACEGFGILAAYADLQDWDGIYFYTLAHSPPGQWNQSGSGHFDLYGDPVKLASLAINGLLFQRSDIRAAPTTIHRHYSREQIIAGMKGDGSKGAFFTPGFPQVIPLMQKTRIRSFDQEAGPYPSITLKDPIVSETGELQWHYGNRLGHVVIDSERSQGLIGFVSKIRPVTRNLSLDVANKFCAVQLASLDGQPIAQADHLFLVATARSGLSGMQWNADRTSLLQFGQKPALVELVQGTVTLNGLQEFKSAEIRYLDGSGHVLKTRQFHGGRKLSIPVGDVPSVWMRLTIQRQ